MSAPGLVSRLAGPRSDGEIAVKTRLPPAIYEELYPDFLAICAVSQIRPLGTAGGGAAGHAVLYLRGARRDEEAPYPTLETCPGTPPGPEHGVGVSVNLLFNSVNWIAIPGRRLFFEGVIDEGESLRQETVDATAREAVEQGLFRGVRFHDRHLEDRPAEKSLEEYQAHRSVGTDYALRFGRSIFCALLPVTPGMIERSVDYLNDLNREVAAGDAGYHWSGYADNCAHTVRNALAAAGVWSEKSVQLVRWLQLFHLAIPANEFANLALLLSDDTLERPKAIWRHKVKRRSLLEHGWLPTRHGAMLASIGVYPDNQVFDTRFKIFVLQTPIFKLKERRVGRLLNDPRYTEIAANLRYFRERYTGILSRRPQRRRTGSDYSDFLAAYHDYIERQLTDVDRKLEILASLDG